MIKYKLTWLDDEVIVSLDTDDPDDFTDIQYEGDRTLIEGVRNWLEHEFGLYGHLIGDRSSPVDLEAAMLSPEAKQYNPKLIKGKEILDSYDPPELA